MQSADLLAAYRRRVLEETRLVNLAGIPLPRDRDGRPIPLEVPLDRVYIRLQALPEQAALAARERERRAVEEEARERRGFLGRLFGRGTRERAQEPPVAGDILAALRTLGEYLYRRGQVYRSEERPEPVDPEEALRNHQRLVVLGAPGAGKTTLLQFLARRAAEDPGGPVPVRVSLRDYATYRGQGGRDSLRVFALERAAGGDAALHRALEEAAEAGHVLWLVDALDEARGWRADAAREAATLPGWLVLTSRPLGYERAGLAHLPHFEVLPLSPQDVETFLRDWFGVLAERRGEGQAWVEERVRWLQEQLRQRPRIAALVRNPLLLTFLVVLAGEDPPRDLPVHRADLYGRYIDELLLTWEYRRRPRAGVESEPALQLGPLTGAGAREAARQGLMWLGWRLHLAYFGGRPQEPPTRAALRAYLARRFEAEGNLGKEHCEALADAVLAFWEEAGLLDLWRLKGDEYLAFRHLTFQEYAAARVLGDLWQRDPQRAWGFLRPRLHHYAWHEVILLTAALLPDATSLVKRVWKAGSPYERELRRDLFLAVEMVGEGAPVAEDLRRALATTLVRLQSPWRRRLAYGILTGMFLAGIIAPWFALPFPWFIMRCVTPLWALAWSLFWLFLVGGDFPLAARTILWLPTRLPYPAPLVRSEVVQTLGRLGEVAVEPLTHALEDEDADVRRAAAVALGRLGEVALEPLTHALRDKKWRVRAAAVRALGQLGEMALEPLIHALGDENWRVRAAAVRALGQLGDPRALEPLTHALEDEAADVRRAAAVALGQLGDPRALEPLTHALEDEAADVRRAAAVALGRLGEVALEPLLHALEDEDADVRRAAAEALGQLGDPRALEPLTHALEDEDADVRRAAAQALGQLGDPRALEPLTHALRDEDEGMRWAAAVALGPLGEVALEPLIHALGDEDEGVRQAAARALGQLADRIERGDQCKRVARSLWWHLTDVEKVASSALAALKQVAARCTELSVASLPITDPLEPSPPSRWQGLLRTSRLALSLAVSAVAGIIGGVISGYLAHMPLPGAIGLFALALLVQALLASRTPEEVEQETPR